MKRRRMTAVGSPSTLVSDVMAWVNTLFGGRIPTLPLPPSWAASLTRLWSTPIVGALPDPSSPKPWTIAVEGDWKPFTWCNATFTQVTIVVRGSSTPPTSRNRRKP
ncbi:MAG: hypothetical protein JWM95_4422 [Gemmatimonadetes bacterium]|nr:hypothetical protein [Gemmatimonadota bacterium]